jgi:hypothetical protein
MCRCSACLCTFRDVDAARCSSVPTLHPPPSSTDLSSIHRYSTEDLDDSLAHLSNTARGMEDANFDEEKFVLVSHSPSSAPASSDQPILRSFSMICQAFFRRLLTALRLFRPSNSRSMTLFSESLSLPHPSLTLPLSLTQ